MITKPLIVMDISSGLEAGMNEPRSCPGQIEMNENQATELKSNFQGSLLVTLFLKRVK